MSANVVSHRHLNLIVNSAYYGPSDVTRHWRHLTYYAAPTATLNGMTAEEVGEQRIVVSDRMAAQRLIERLYAANRISVAYRYNQNATDDDLPGYMEGLKIGFMPLSITTRLTMADTLVAIDGYEYQSCEVPDWSESEAYQFCDALRRAIVTHLPGYDDSECWSIPPERTAA